MADDISINRMVCFPEAGGMGAANGFSGINVFNGLNSMGIDTDVDLAYPFMGAGIRLSCKITKKR